MNYKAWRDRAAVLLARRPDYVWNPSRSMAVVAVVIASIAYALVALNTTYPNIALDELVMVANSRVIAGAEPEWHLQGWGFAPGLAVLIAPAWWLTDDVVTVFRMGVALSAVLGVLAIWPLAALARRVGASPNAAVVVASVVAVAPARLLHANYFLSETLFMLVTAATIVAAARLSERATWLRAVILGFLTGAVFLVHLRGASLVIAVGIWGVTMLSRLRWSIVVAGLSAVISTLVAYALYLWVTAQIFSAEDRRLPSTFAGASGRRTEDVIASVIGQSWYAVFAWAGLTIVGAIWAARFFLRNSLARLLALSAITSLVLSTIGLNARFGVSSSDQWYYGRYNDQMWAALAVVGLAVLVRLRWSLVSVLTVTVSAIASCLMLAVTVPLIGVLGGRWSEFNTLGVVLWLDADRYAESDPQAWPWIVAASVLLTTFSVLSAWWRAAVAPLLFTFWVMVSLWHDGTFLDVFEARSAGLPADTELWEVLPEETKVGVASDLSSYGNFFVFYSTPHIVEQVDLDDLPDDIDVVFAKATATTPKEEGARVLNLWDGLYVAWVYPGEVFDVLESEGLLAAVEEPPGLQSEAN